MDWDEVRKDFPVLERKIDGKRIIYFDNACMSLKPKQVIESIIYYYEFLSSCGGGRSSHPLSLETDLLCEISRDSLGEFIGANKDEIVWTKNTTEGINLVVNSLKFSKNDNVVCEITAHNSVLLPLWRLEKRGIIRELRIVKPSDSFIFKKTDWKDMVDENTKLVVINLASNVTGFYYSERMLKEIIKLVHSNGGLVLGDAAQYIPHKKTNVKKLGIDFLAFSIHKMCGPTGLGVLYGKKKLLEDLDPFIVGGETIRDVVYLGKKVSPEFLPSPRKFEAGLQNYSAIIAVKSVVDYFESIGMEKIEKRDREISKTFLDLVKELKGVKIVGPLDLKNRISIFSLFFDKLSAYDVFMRLNENDKYVFALRVGHHCTNIFHYFKGISPINGGTLRASLYFYNNEEEIKIFFSKLKNVLNS